MGKVKILKTLVGQSLKQAQHKIFAGVILLFLAFFVSILTHKIVMAVGNVTELPFIGSYNVYFNTTSGGGVDPTPIDGYTQFCGAGQTCGPYDNYNFNTRMRLIDNTDNGFSLTGTASCWNNTTNGFHRDGLGKSVIYYQYCSGTTGNPTRIGTWTPSLPAAGYYHIYVFAPNHSGIVLTQNARYQIYSNNTLIATVSVNQNGYNNDWVRLGMWYLSTSGTYIRLTNQTSDGQRVAYDAVMFVEDF